MGLAELLLGKTNPFAQWANSNQNMLGSIGAGLAAGPDFASGMGKAAQYVPQGRAADAAIYEKQLADQKLTDQISATEAWALEQNRPELAQMLKMGMKPADVWAFAHKDTDKSNFIEINGQLVNQTTGEIVGDYRDDPAAGIDAPKWSLTPTWLRDTDPNSPTFGKLVLGQLNDGGGLTMTETPGGLTPLGPIELAGGKQLATVDAKTQGEARALLPGAQQANSVLAAHIAEIRNNQKGMDEWFGQWGARGSYVLPGSAMGNFKAATDPANAQAFMQARKMLMGGGQITDYEGKRGEDAFSRMAAAIATGDQQSYLRALDDFESAVEDGYAKLVATSQGGYSDGGFAGQSSVGASDAMSRADALLNGGIYILR